jgi:hypothetical protein
MGYNYTYFLKGPVWTQPPPLPAGMPAAARCWIFSPLPLSEVSLPSKMGDFSGSWAQRPQSQY